MALGIETLINFYGYYPIVLGDALPSKTRGTTFSTLLLTLYHNFIKFLSIGLLIITIMAISRQDYATTFIRIDDETNYPIFVLIMFNLISNVATYLVAGYACRSNSILMKWTEVFQLLNQSKVSTVNPSVDNSPDLVQTLTQFTKKMTTNCITFIIVRGTIIGLLITSIYLRRESTLSLTVYGNNPLVQLILPMVLIFYTITYSSFDHVNSHLFDIMVEYFILKFRVINNRIAAIVKSGRESTTNTDTVSSTTQTIPPKSLHETELRSILDQHDTLKVDLKLYDKYWASININTLLVKPLVCLFCVYQLTFRVQTIESLLFLWAYLIEAVYLFIHMFTSGTSVSDEIDAVCANGLRLILFNYSIPVLQRLQLFNQHIMFTEIGFSCGGLFTFTLDSVHDALIELTQDFLLTLDFVITVRQARSLFN